MRAIHASILLSGMFLLAGGCCNWRALFQPPDQHSGSAAAAASPPSSPPTAGGPGWQAPAPTPAAPPPGVFNEQISLMSQQLRDTEDNKRVLAVRVRQLENQLRDKDLALKQANAEIQEAVEQVASTRKELQRWKQEMENLRGKLRNVERDNKSTLEAIIHTVEQFLDREKTASKEVELLPPPERR